MSKNILIIEDDDFLRNLLSKSFTSEGFTVASSPNGVVGLKKVKEIKPDLVLLDILLPEVNGIAMDGFGVLSGIREDASIAQIPVVLLSNMKTQEAIQKGVKLGAIDYFIKSQFTSDEIVKKATAILEKK